MKILKFIAQALFTTAIAIVASWAFYNYAPVNIFEHTTAPKAGAAFTQLIGSNTISAFPTTYNANLTITANTSAANTFSGLETDAAGLLSQASSTVVGNFTSTGTVSLGSLVLLNPLTVPYGGTSSTTLDQYAVLVGNGTGGVLTPSNGLGTNGQFLTSNGAGVAPNWTTSAINQASNYTWTGLHIFNTGGIIDTASSTVAANASNKLTLNALSYIFPSTRGASSTSLEENGSGGLTFESPSISVASQNNYVNSGVQSNATTSVFTLVIPAGTLSNFARLTSYWSEITQNCVYGLGFGNGSATTSIAFVNGTNGTGTTGLLSSITTNIDATSTTAEFLYSLGANPANTSLSSIGVYSAMNLSANTYIEFDVRSPPNDSTCSLTGYTFEVL